MIKRLSQLGHELFNNPNAPWFRAHPFVQAIQELANRFFPNRPLLGSQKPLLGDRVQDKTPLPDPIEHQEAKAPVPSIPDEPPVPDSDPAKTPTSVAPLANVETKKQEPLKLFQSNIQWAGHSYTVTQYLPESTTTSEWDALVENYKDILKDHEEESGVAHLTLTLDRPNKEVKINIPERSKILTVRNHRAVNALLSYYTNREINQEKKELQDSLGKRNIADTDGKESGPATETADAPIPRTISQVDTKTLRIKNKGNTCFIASVCQSWLIYQKDSLLRKSNNPKTTKNEKETIQALLDWINTYETTTQDEIDVSPIIELLKSHQPRWFEKNALQQQDAAELITWLDSFIQPATPVFVRRTETIDSNALKPGEEILDMGDRVEVPYPGSISISPDQIVSVNKHVIKPGQNLLGALRKYFSPQDVKGENAVLQRYVTNRETIPEERRIPIIERREILSTAPDELKVQIKRFVSDSSTRNTYRLGGPLEIPETFAMPGDFFENGKEAVYELQSVVSHLGESVHRGHYTALIKKQNEFFHADDERITPISKDQMLKMASLGYLFVFRKKPS